MVVLEQRRAGEANERPVGQGQPKVARKPARLRPVRLVRDYNDVIAGAVRLPRADLLVELLDQAEDVTVVFAEEALQVFSVLGARSRLRVRGPATGERFVDLVIQILPVGHQQEGELARNRAPDFLGEEDHRVRFAAALRVPEHAQLAQFGMHGFDPLQLGFGDLPRPFPGHQAHVGVGQFRRGQLHDAVFEPQLRWELLFQTLLPPHGGHRVVDAQHLMVPRDNFACLAGLAGVEEDEVLHEVQQSVVREHPVQQRLRFHAPWSRLVVAFPFSEMLPVARDGTIAGSVPVADDQEGVVVKGMGDDVLVEIVTEVAIEAGPDVLVDRLEFNEHQRQTIHEADEVGAAVIARRPQACEFQLAHREEPVVRLAIRCGAVAEINDLCPTAAELAFCITVIHWHAVADVFVELLVVLEQRPGEIALGQPRDGLFKGRRRQLWVEPPQRVPKVPLEHGLAGVRAPERAVRPERLLVPRIDTFPTQLVAQMLRKRLLDEPVFAVDVGVGHAELPYRCTAPFPKSCSRASATQCR